MSKSSTTRSDIPKIELATQRQLGFRAIANDNVDAEGRKAAERERVYTLTSLFYEIFRHALGESGGPEALRARLDETDSFKTAVSKGVNRVKDGTGQRHVPLEWLAGVAVDADGALTLMADLGEALGFEPPVRKRTISEADDVAAEREAVRELPEEIREMIDKRKAKKLGVRVEDLKR